MLKARINLFIVKFPAITAAVSVIPRCSATCGTPPAKIMNAALTVMPRNPHTSALGTNPKPDEIYLPVRILSPSISPRVARTENLMKLAVNAHSVLKYLKKSYNLSEIKKGRKYSKNFN